MNVRSRLLSITNDVINLVIIQAIADIMLTA